VKELKLIGDENVSLREAVYQTLRRAILTNELEPGERLMEMKLASQLGVSRTPVREAIHMLEKESLVTQEPHRGVVVAGITRKQSRDVLEVRSMLEELAVRLACRRATEEQFDQLKEAAADFERSVKEQTDITALADKDVAFHDVIYRMTDNEKLIQIVANLWQQIYRYRIEYLKNLGKGEDLVKEHWEMVEALCSRNEELAVKEIRSHISNQEAAIENLLTEKE
jgi:DNA-binding GntR family transcriptional regulator